MATTKTLEARFEHLSMKDEKENGNSDRTYGKQKVLDYLTQCNLVGDPPCWSDFQGTGLFRTVKQQFESSSTTEIGSSK